MDSNMHIMFLGAGGKPSGIISSMFELIINLKELD